MSRLIDADALKANLRVSQGVLDDYGIVYVPYRDVVACIDAAPTVEQEPAMEPVRFRVVQQRRSYPFWEAVCDGCGYQTSTIHTNWKYCPWCGRAVKWDD